MGGSKSTKFKFKQALQKITKVKTWQLVLILIPLLFICATLLRLDHIKMTELKAAVIAADEAEDDEKIESTMAELKEFVRHNIVVNIIESNGIQKVTFSTGPFYLEHLYTRKAAEIIAEAEAHAASDENPNGNVFAKAMEVCKPQAIANGWVWNSEGYINCMTGEINKYPTTDRIIESYTVEIPSTSLYRFDYSSLIWAPTLSGFLILIAAIIALVIVLRTLTWLFIRVALIFLK